MKKEKNMKEEILPDPFDTNWMDDIFENDVDIRTPTIKTEELSSSKYNGEFTEKELEIVLEGLNEDQKTAVLGIIEYIFINKENKKFYLVQGGGGVGKSFAVARAMTLLFMYNVIAAAPSHFAKNVLDDNIIENGIDDIDVYTVAALMGKKLTFNDKGERILVPAKGTPPIRRSDIVIIDEVSMIDDETSVELLEMCKYKKLILLGDYCQLPPVKQQQDNLFFREIGAELLQPMRFTGDLYDLTQIIREEINRARKGLFSDMNIINKKTSRISRIGDNGSGYIFVDNFGHFIQAAIRRFKENKGSFHVRILAYRNRTIDKINEIVRKALYGDNAAQFEEGELVINEGGYDQLINNGEILTVKKATKVIGPYSIPCLNLKFRDKKINKHVFVVSTEGKEMYDRILQTKKTAAKQNKYKWGAYFDFLDSFAYFKYSYSSSVHKAQGSTITNVFILDDDILSIKPIGSKEKLQSLYVAITRASFRAIIYNKKFKVDQSQLTKENLNKRYNGGFTNV